MKKLIIYQLFLGILIYSASYGQFIEDALRYSTNNAMLTPRASAFGVAYYGVADDIASLYYNPAGLTVSKKNELSIGLGFTRNSSETNFLGSKDILKSNNEYLTHIGYISPFETKFGQAALGIAYFRESDFHNYMRFDAFNRSSSFIADQAANGARNYNDNMATYLSLANDNFFTPIKDSLNQSAIIRETGSLNSIIGGAAFDITDNLALGFTLQGKWGSYKYSRDFEETDIFNKYRIYDPDDFTDIDFTRLTVNEDISQSVSGFTGSIAVQSRIGAFMRIGLNIKLPTVFSVEENFSQIASVEFDNGDISENEYKNRGRTSYNVKTPFIYGIGASAYIYGLLISASAEYSDLTQLEFSEGSNKIQQYNLMIISELTGQFSWGFGAEYEIPGLPIIARAGFGMTSSPYSKNIDGADFSFYSFGTGIFVAPNIKLDLSFRYSEQSHLRTNYISGSGSQYTFKKSPFDLGLMLTYRY